MKPLTAPATCITANPSAIARSIDPSLSPCERTEARGLLDHDYGYVDHELFHQSDRQAEQKIFTDAPPVPTPNISWYARVMEGVADSRAALKSIATPLTSKQEQALFLQFNYCRYRAASLHKKLNNQHRMTAPTARRMLTWHEKAHHLRDQIADTNIALVLAMAKRTRLHESDFADLISEGNMALLRAVDKFDASRGFKFSTYGCRAILKAFSRTGMKMTRHRQRFPVEYDPEMERSNGAEIRHAEHETDCASEVRDILDHNRAELTSVEHQVIEHRFAIKSALHKRRASPAQPMTLEQVGKVIGVTKERVRQIQNKALVKIRASLEDDFLR